MSSGEQKNTTRRKFLKQAGLGGAIAAGTIALGGLPNPLKKGQATSSPGAGPSQSPPAGNAEFARDYVEAYEFLPVVGTSSITRNPDGTIASLAYGPFAVTVARDATSAVSSVVYADSNENFTRTIAVTRNADGSIASVAMS